jgi:hypothetical protein
MDYNIMDILAHASDGRNVFKGKFGPDKKLVALKTVNAKSGEICLANEFFKEERPHLPLLLGQR